MADGGFSDYGSPDEASMAVMDEYSELSMAGDGEEYVEPSKEETEAFKKHEIEVAVADAQCKKDVGYDDALTKLTHTAEQEFVDEHKSELDALIAKYGTKQ